MADQRSERADDDLAEVWRALQGAAGQARIRVATAADDMTDPTSGGELRELRHAVEALHRAVVALAERTTAAERQIADLRAAQHDTDRQAADVRAPEAPPVNTATVDEAAPATGRQFDRSRPRRGYGQDS